MNAKAKMVYQTILGGAAAYTTFKLLDKKADELVTEGGVINALAVGAGQQSISSTVGLIVAYTIGQVL
jgi:hypothetical protein